MTQTKRNYLATFIIDNRNKEDSLGQIVDEIKAEIAAVEGEVTAVEELGKRDFARVTDRKFTGAPYVRIAYTAPGTAPCALRERLRLNNSVYRTFIQAAA